MRITEMSAEPSPNPRVVIIGAGFGGLAAAKALGGQPVQVTVLDRENHHLFQPLLYQVATAGLSPANIAQPVRGILGRHANIEVLMADVTGFDLAKKFVIAGRHRVPFDFLIVATGARHSYFGRPEWEAFAPGLKTLEDALEIRRRLLLAFEKAEVETDPVERERLLTFVIVGGGPTGVEMAGAISEIARETMVRDFRHIDPREAQVILIDASDRLLPAFDTGLSHKAEDQLGHLKVSVKQGVRVQDVTAEGVSTPEGFIHARTVIWAAGNEASPLVKALPGSFDRSGRIHVTEMLNLPEAACIYVIGDTAFCLGKDNQPLPGVSPVAMQQGRHAAHNILALIEGRPLKKFSYSDRGSMATIGRHRAVADLHFAKFSGFPAWLTWVFVHLIFLMSFRNRVSVFLIWVWSYFTRTQGARLITGKKS
ncbi:NAD(P)/FAD-dependent oxidoreductase [Prosthecobacter sp.]|uniref:NAD(P)/FAD-dependent oxidoreductase n=1 Tax=Prosthecobacter sp. TaxID=1965333 RepID=UPI0025EED5AA|nr:NAD(P)/FAD-dependent oxidoreductase [Prosthecobacter sp.]